MELNDAMTVLTPLLLNLAVGVITLVIAWVGNEVRKLQKANANNANFQFIEQVAGIAVAAAEQLYGSAAGETKKAYAIDLAEKWFAERGITVDADVIVAQIEAAVLREFNYPESEISEPGGGAETPPGSEVSEVEEEFNETLDEVGERGPVI